MHKRGKLRLNIGKEWKMLLFQMHRSHRKLYFEYRSRAEDENEPIHVATAQHIAYEHILRIELSQSTRADHTYQFTITLRLNVDDENVYVTSR